MSRYGRISLSLISCQMMLHKQASRQDNEAQASLAVSRAIYEVPCSDTTPHQQRRHTPTYRVISSPSISTTGLSTLILAAMTQQREREREAAVSATRAAREGDRRRPKALRKSGVLGCFYRGNLFVTYPAQRYFRSLRCGGRDFSVFAIFAFALPIHNTTTHERHR